MALQIRNTDSLSGIKVKINSIFKYIKLTQLADDTTLFLNSVLEVKIALQIIETFGKHSGLILNKNKTDAMFIGKLKNCSDFLCDINWPDGPIKSLGVFFGHNRLQCNELNLSSKIENCEKILIHWKKRNLTFFGKIQIIKTLLLLKFVYLAKSTVVPQEKINTLNKLFFKFLWNDKREKIKRSTLIGTKSKGGIEMFDVPSFFNSLKIKWITNLCNCKNANWTILPIYFLNIFGDNYLIFLYVYRQC